MGLLTYEARNSAVLNSGCSTAAAEKKWINCYIESSQDPEKRRIIRSPSCKKFKFGEGETK